ncbi:MAG: hypothetical protein WB392_15675, partial [Methanotrichaceae archaeon]
GINYQDNAQTYDQYGQGQYDQPGYNSQYGSSSSSQVITPPTGTYNYNNYYYDWLSPGTLYWPYSYPAYYNYNYDDYWWYSHNPTYYYTTPVTHYYTWYPAAYSWGPWYAPNIYGLGSKTYYYSSSWSYHSGGFFFDP